MLLYLYITVISLFLSGIEYGYRRLSIEMNVFAIRTQCLYYSKLETIIFRVG